ncbi:hypothetical protein Slin15195_G102560 [Septoria linicola]|uniref:BZIP domain-containing protein n=1 Tax=Septoria linicola TaxID=215465 RepID=A0A9Q9B3X2_9PEZI|nr:hypothetical protein Slin14017_G065560 [Septoria linicola]USW56937.1 hypothetical protein Slin15195_G102560 [Septoria linicola]
MSHQENTTHREPCSEDAVLVDAPASVSLRRLKKREVDRRCQRKARAKKQSHIEYLEALVETLKQQDSSGQVAALHRQLQRTEDERARLATTLGEIQLLLGHHESQPDGVDHQSCTSAGSHVNPSVDSGVPVQDEELAIQKSNTYEWIKSAHSCCCSAHVLRQPGWDAVWQGNYWKFIADVLDERFDWTDDTQPADDDESDDVLVRAVLEGWDAVEERAPLHPSLQMLRRVDEATFGPIPMTERLAMLRAMHLQLQYHTEPSSERHEKLPPWYTYRPSHHIPHTYAVDYWAWPHFRQRFISNEHTYCGNGFFRMYQEQMRLLWPFEFRDCYTHDLETGLYKPSRLFDERINNINCWTMGPDFFEKFPELSGVIPTNLRGVPKSMPAAGGVVMRKRLSPPSSTLIKSARSTGFIVPDEDDQECPDKERENGTRSRPPAYTPLTAGMHHQSTSRPFYSAQSQQDLSSLTTMPPIQHTFSEAHHGTSSSATEWQDLWSIEIPSRDMPSSRGLSIPATCEASEPDWLW